ncbi:MAG: BON domain-containing protein [Planctomycetota bacterium]
MVAVLAMLTLLGQGMAAAQDDGGLDDQEIALAVENELLYDEGVNPHNMDISVYDGVVKLEGTADHLLAKRRAVRLAGGVRGVRSIVDMLEVHVPAGQTDAELRNAVAAALVRDPAVERDAISISAEAGRVTLAGQASSWQERRIAGAAVAGVDGVRAIENEIEVPETQHRPDGEIREDILRRFEIDVWLDAERFTVDVEDGRVLLAGTVGSLDERRRAIEAAWVAGVELVNAENLAVDPLLRSTAPRRAADPIRSDESIREAVRDALLFHPRVHSFNPDIHVEDGVVTLSGSVENLPARQAAGQVAEDTVGVVWVRNRLKVRPFTTPGDPVLKERVAEALAADPYVDRNDIRIRVRNGRATLKGDVGSYFNVRQAQRVAERVAGVVDVRNRLRGAAGPPRMHQEKTDPQLVRDVRDQLRWNPYLGGAGVEVRADEGVVSLAGTVEDYRAVRAAVDEALSAGARQVVTAELTVASD